MNFRKIPAMIMATVMVASMFTGCKTACPPCPETDTSIAVTALNDAQAYNDFDVKVEYVYDTTLETAMKKAAEDDKLVNDDATALINLMGIDTVDQMELYGIKTEDDGTIKEGVQTVVYVRSDDSYKGMTDEAWIKAVAAETNVNYSFLKTELDGNQVTDTTGTYDVEWNFTYSGKTAMVKDIDEDGNVTRWVAVILTCNITASKTLVD